MLFHYNCLGLFVVYSKQCCLQTNKYDQSLRVTDMYILTKFHYYMLFRFPVTRVKSEEEEGEGEDEQNSLS